MLAAGSAEAPVRPIAGGTDLMVSLTGELHRPRPASSICGRSTRCADRHRRRLSLARCPDHLYRHPPPALCREHVPALVDAAATIGAAQIQNRGTLGGNIANASPAGDTLPVLLAADAVIVVGSERGERVVPAADFWTGYRQTALAHDELIVRIRLPLVAEREMRFRKVGTRRAQAISKVALAVAWQGDGTWRDVRVALASVAPTPIRARAAVPSRADRRRRRPPMPPPQRRWPAN